MSLLLMVPLANALAPSPLPDLPGQPDAPVVPGVPESSGFPGIPEVPEALGALGAPEPPKMPERPDVPALVPATACEAGATGDEDPLRAALLAAPITVWTSRNMGAGSCLDADLLDGHQADHFLGAIAAEAQAREGADAALYLRVDGILLDVDAQLGALRVADEALAEAVDGEARARGAADATLAERLEVVRSVLVSEEEDRRRADAALATALQGEATARSQGDAGLAEQVDALLLRLDHDLPELWQAVETEVSARETADADAAEALQRLAEDLRAAQEEVAAGAAQVDQRFLAEAAARAAADHDQVQGLAVEAALRGAADQDHAQALAVEAATRLAGEAVQARGLAGEAAARTAADGFLGTRATAVEGRAGALEGRATALEGRASALEGRAAALEGWTQGPVLQGPGNPGPDVHVPGATLTYRQTDPGGADAYLLRLQHDGFRTLRLTAHAESFGGPPALLDVSGEVTTNFLVLKDTSWATCRLDQRGAVSLVLSDTGGDQLRVCLRNAQGTYQWVALS